MRRAALAAIAGLAGLAVSALPATVVPGGVAVAAGSAAGASGASPAPSYQPVGIPVQGSKNPVGGTPLRGPGLYLDSLQRGSTSTGTAGSSKYYTVELHKGETPWFSATMIVPPGYSSADSGEVDLDVKGLNDDSCDWYDSDNEYTTGHTVPPLSVAFHTPTVGGPDWPKECPPNGGTFVVNVYRSGTLFANNPMPLELGFRIEPPADTAGLPPAAHEGSQLAAQRHGQPARPLTAGYSFDNAPLIGSGTYSDSIVTGQTRFFRIHLNWGQRFAYQINSTPVSINAFSLTAQTTIFNPVRDGVEQQSDSNNYQTDFGGKDASALAGSTLATARYTNRSSESSDVQDYAIDGDYFLALTLSYRDSNKPVRIPYTLVVSVSGQVERGPSYAASAVPQPPGSSSGAPRSSSADAGGVSAWEVGGIAVAAAAALLLIGLLLRGRGADSGARDSGGLTTTVGPVRPEGTGPPYAPSNVPPNASWPPSAVPPQGLGPPPR